VFGFSALRAEKPNTKKISTAAPELDEGLPKAKNADRVTSVSEAKSAGLSNQFTFWRTILWLSK